MRDGNGDGRQEVLYEHGDGRVDDPAAAGEVLLAGLELVQPLGDEGLEEAVVPLRLGLLPAEEGEAGVVLVAGGGAVGGVVDDDDVGVQEGVAVDGTGDAAKASAANISDIITIRVATEPDLVMKLKTRNQASAAVAKCTQQTAAQGHQQRI